MVSLPAMVNTKSQFKPKHKFNFILKNHNFKLQTYLGQTNLGLLYTEKFKVFVKVNLAALAIENSIRFLKFGTWI